MTRFRLDTILAYLSQEACIIVTLFEVILLSVLIS